MLHSPLFVTILEKNRAKKGVSSSPPPDVLSQVVSAGDDVDGVGPVGKCLPR